MGIVGHPAGWGVGSVDELVGSKFKGVTPLNLLDNSFLFFTLLQLFINVFCPGVVREDSIPRTNHGLEDSLPGNKIKKI